MDRAAFAKLESAVCSNTFTQRCTCCDAKELVNQWHLTGGLAFCKKCLPTGTSPQDVLQVGGTQTTCQSLSQVVGESCMVPAPGGIICALEHVILPFR